MGSLSGIDLAIAAWIVAACGVAIFMVRRGHRPARWGLFALILGPLAILPAAWARFRSRTVESTLLSEGSPRTDGLSVLVGIDGSGEALEALSGALETMGDRISQLTLATVLDFETAADDTAGSERDHAEQRLERAASLVRLASGPEPNTMLLAGAPATALVEQATSHGDDLVVVGSHGRGESDWLFGNTTSALARQESVRVMIIAGGSPLRTLPVID